MYAGFWKRFVAYLIDSIIFSIAYFIIAIPMGLTTGLAGAAEGADQEAVAGLSSMFTGVGLLITLFGPWLYFAIMESSKLQGTVGKLAMGIKVTTMEGAKISFLRATGRYFAKIISGLIFLIGYIIAGFTAKKQALHDMIAGTLVVNKNA